jgi:hypothetical protein
MKNKAIGKKLRIGEEKVRRTKNKIYKEKWKVK